MDNEAASSKLSSVSFIDKFSWYNDIGFDLRQRSCCLSVISAKR